MSGPVAPPTDGAGTQRLHALTDGVFSIVLTLMVFNIALPKEHERVELTRALFDLWPSLLAYGISFGLAGIYWTAHQGIFRSVRRTSHELGWLNILFLAFVSLIPFSTTLLATHHAEPVALGVYGANLMMVGVAMVPIWRYITRNPRLLDATPPPKLVRYGYSRILLGTFGYGLATALAFLDTRLALVVFAAVPWLYIVPAIHRAWLRLFGLDLWPGESPDKDLKPDVRL